VHAKGSGAHGHFVVHQRRDHQVHDGKAYSTPVRPRRRRLSFGFRRWVVIKGSADTARDPRGFALKFYTEEGNWDMTGNNTPRFLYPQIH